MRGWYKLLLLLVVAGLALLPLGCPRSNDSPNKLRVGFVGLTCEAPIFAAYENGYFKDEGLDVELIRTSWDGLREGLGPKTDAIQTLLMYSLKPIENGLDVKITGGVHTGCLRLQVAAKSSIKHAKELKGKTIGVATHLGSPPYLFTSRVLLAAGIDPDPQKKEVTWVAIPDDALGQALENGQVDAIATSDPIGTILVGTGVARTIADQAIDAPFCDEYCCVVVVSGKLSRENPDAAAKFTRAMFKASKWVEANSQAAAKLAVESKNKYISASVELNAQALAQLKYTPGVANCKQSIAQAAREMQKAGLLKATTDPDKLTQKCWLDLDGVTDDWIKGVKVAEVTGGGRPARMSAFTFALLCRDSRWPRGCCSAD